MEKHVYKQKIGVILTFITLQRNNYPTDNIAILKSGVEVVASTCK